MFLEKTVIHNFLNDLRVAGIDGTLIDRVSSTDVLAKLSQYCQLLAKWNNKISLTRVLSSESMLKEEFLFAPFYYSISIPPQARKVLDIGSGNGIPGVLCSLMHPEMQFVFCEVDYRKAVFLQELVRHLKQANVLIKNCDYRLLRDTYDAVTFKNVSRRDSFLLSLVPLLSQSGHVLFQTNLQTLQLLKKNSSYCLSGAYNIPATKESYLVDLVIVPRETN